VWLVGILRSLASRMQRFPTLLLRSDLAGVEVSLEPVSAPTLTVAHVR
jgi:hypothetical protein